VSFPWLRASATGVGSYPGDDPAEALRIVLGELPELPHLPELPGRGPGADLAGRAAGLLVDLPVELRPSGWRFADNPGRDLRRAHDFMSWDLDALEEQAGSYEGPFKIQVCGPWTLAASIELGYGDRALKDPGAVRDLTTSLAEGVAAHVADVRRRVPGAVVLLQLDEPGLPGVLAGTVPTASGFGRLAAVEDQIAVEGLREVIDAVAGTAPADGGAAGADAAAAVIVHCCAPNVPYDVLRRAGAGAISVDLTLVSRRAEDAIGETIDAGVGLFLGVVPGTDAVLPGLKETAAPVRGLWRRIGFPPERLAEQVVLTPVCGLDGASPGYVRTALARCREAARMLYEAPG
jgi:hypothetical protein